MSTEDGKLIGDLNGLLLVVSDLERSLAWYTDVLGCRLLEKGHRFAYLNAGDFLLVLQESDDATKAASDHFIIIQVPDIDVAQDRLEERGVKFHMPAVPFFKDQFGTNFSDPDGHTLTIMGPKT